MTKLKPGTRVRKDMGLRQSGVVVPPFPKSAYTDGQYREPQPNEVVVFVKWDDGTQGWVHGQFLNYE